MGYEYIKNADDEFVVMGLVIVIDQPKRAAEAFASAWTLGSTSTCARVGVS